MSIVAATMAKGNAMRYESASGAIGAMDGKRSLANSSGSDYKGMVNKDKAFDTEMAKDELEYEVSGKMDEQSDSLKDEWAESFGVFGGEES